MAPLKVLVLHGCEAERRRIVRQLDELGSFEARDFQHGRDARAGCKDFCADIVIVDSSAEDVATLELIERCTTSHGRSRIILTSGRPAAAMPDGQLGKLANAVVWAPFNLWELRQVIQDQVRALSEMNPAC